ncbi:hypothetical protein SCHPADRAFT_462330 [Schizopora paradoxa]|uniref:Uncharacterized protein n=1 Tax=Schizopora paradoxa TaxID=27342 RepID=A0A0H2RHZ9_9AGAM|nr:hypothetical protein SCHPADRAFT_462330 [Schizopora paradoxa]
MRTVNLRRNTGSSSGASGSTRTPVAARMTTSILTYWQSGITENDGGRRNGSKKKLRNMYISSLGSVSVLVHACLSISRGFP